MNKFSELVKQGVAAFRYNFDAQQTPSQNPICREYNNIYGAATDTHMTERIDGSYMITGSLISKKDDFDHFKWAIRFAGVNFHHSGLNTFNDWCDKHNLVGKYGENNGDEVYILRTKTEEDMMKNPCNNLSPSYAYVSDSKIPIPVRFLTHDQSIMSIKECIEKTWEDTATAMNESRWVLGNTWRTVELSDGMHITGEVNGKLYLI